MHVPCCVIHFLISDYLCAYVFRVDHASMNMQTNFISWNWYSTYLF